MSLALGEFHFLRPAWLLAVLLVPFGIWLWRRTRSAANRWASLVDAHLLPHLLVTGSAQRRGTAAWLAASLWVLACLALAGPAWEREPMPLYRNDAARVIALELAPTMLASDIRPSRLERARYRINDILDASRDQQTALIAYAGDAFVVAPLTSDVNTVRNLLDALTPDVMPVAGNATDKAIDSAVRLIRQAGLNKGDIILVADSAGEGAIESARAAQADGMRVSVLGVGSDKGAPIPLGGGGFLSDDKGNIVLPRLDEAGLRQLASAGGGRYARLDADGHDLATLLDASAVDARDAPASTGESARSARFVDRGAWLILPMLVLALLCFRRGWLVVFVLAVAVPPRAQAFEWADLWSRPDQRAAAALAEGRAADAKALAKDPALQGSAAYRADDFAAAGKAWNKLDTADAHYNRGNALAKQGEYEKAIQAYDAALAKAPGMEDAKANRKAVEEWLKRHQEQEQKSNQSQNQQGQSSDSKQGSSGQSSQAQSGQDESSSESKPEQSEGSDFKSTQEQQGDQSAGQPSGAEQGQDAKPPEQAHDGKAGSDASKPADPGQDQPSPGQEPPADGKGSDAAEAQSQAEAAASEAQRAEDQGKLSQAIDQALKQPTEGTGRGVTRTPEEQAAEENRQALQQWLQRIPDDPGGLLRRKFQLEHQRRQREGDDKP